MHVTASGTIERLLEIAKGVSATIERGFLGGMKSPDVLIIQSHTELGDDPFDSFDGQMAFWSNDFGESL